MIRSNCNLSSRAPLFARWAAIGRGERRRFLGRWQASLRGAGIAGVFGEVANERGDGALVRTIEGLKMHLRARPLSDGKTLATGSYDQKIKFGTLQTASNETLSA